MHALLLHFDYQKKARKLSTFLRRVLVLLGQAYHKVRTHLESP